jgi:DNA-binding Lrp family transcriptional regulator
LQRERQILSAFYDGRRLNVKEIEERTGLPWTSMRNHVRRMVKSGTLKHTKERMVDSRFHGCIFHDVSYYEVIR